MMIFGLLSSVLFILINGHLRGESNVLDDEKGFTAATGDALSFFEIFQLTQTGKKGVKKRAQKPESFILHRPPCSMGHGLGTILHTIRVITDIAVSQNLGLVCQPAEWETGGHGTGNMGYLFGCKSETETEGEFFPIADVLRDSTLTWENVTAIATEETTFIDKTLHRLSKPVQAGRIYNLADGCNWIEQWGKGWRFFRSQYHLVREKDPSRLRKKADGFTIAVMIRRGDGGMHGVQEDGRGFKVHTYALAVEKFLDHYEMAKREVKILVIAQESEDSEDAKNLVERFSAMSGTGKYAIVDVKFSFGVEETERQQVARERLVRDLDMASLSDVLILSKGSFSSLAAAIQFDGKAFSIVNERHRNDLPNMIPDLPGIEYKKQRVSGKSGNNESRNTIRLSDSISLVPFPIESTIESSPPH